MVVRILYILFFLIINLKAFSSVFDSAKYYIKNYKPQIIGGLSGRNTFIGSSKNKVAGIYTGVEYGNKIGFTAGIYWLSSPINKTVTYNAFQPDEYKQKEISKFWYLGLQSDYKFYKNKKWTLNIPLRLGMGSANTRCYDLSLSKNFIKKNNIVIFPVESGMDFLYSINWWIGISGGLGSRIVLGNNTSYRYSGTYYTFGTVIFFSNIYKKIPLEYRSKMDAFKPNILK